MAVLEEAVDEAGGDRIKPPPFMVVETCLNCVDVYAVRS